MKRHRYEHEFYTSKATLLVRHIHKLYTMKCENGKPIIYEDAFFAIHHDFIMAVGEGDGKQYCDKDTQIIDAYGCCVVPGFIDVCYQFVKESDVERMSNHALFLQARQNLSAMRASGVTSINLKDYQQATNQKKMMQVYQSFQQQRVVSLYQIESNPTYPIKTAIDCQPLATNQCLSVGFNGDINDLFLYSKIYYRTTNCDAYEILAAMTCNSAMSLGIDHERGFLVPDLQADFIIMRALDIDFALSMLSPSFISHVYREGQCIWQGRLRQ